jgi:hypothetical protein
MRTAHFARIVAEWAHFSRVMPEWARFSRVMLEWTRFSSVARAFLSNSAFWDLFLPFADTSGKFLTLSRYKQ